MKDKRLIGIPKHKHETAWFDKKAGIYDWFCKHCGKHEWGWNNER